MATVWQVAAGEAGRRYSQLFRSHDVMLLGPGAIGRFEASTYARAVADGIIQSAKRHVLRSFAEDVSPGDIVLLREGHRVVSVGVAADAGYDWNPAFDDVWGWDLQHSHRVLWFDDVTEALADIQKEQAVFAARKSVPMFSRVADERVLSQVRPLFDGARSTPRPLRALPKPPSKKLTDEKLGELLFARGLSNATTEDVIAALRRQRRMARWYADQGPASNRPSEHEVVGHMILPLLLALGWSEQLVAVEWQRVDVACFSTTPTTRDACTMVIEAKGWGHGLANVLPQALRYVRDLKLTGCDKIVLTQGTRFYIYERQAEWPEHPTLYFNVESMRVQNSDGTDGVQALLSLLPSRPR